MVWERNKPPTSIIILRRRLPEEIGTLTEVIGSDKLTGLYRVLVLVIHRFGAIMKRHGCTPPSPNQTCLEFRWFTPENPFSIDKRISSLFQNILYFSAALTSNLEFLEVCVPYSTLFRMKIGIAL